MKRPFVEAFKDSYTGDNSIYFSQDEGYTLDWVRDTSSHLVVGTASALATSLKHLFQLIQESWKESSSSSQQPERSPKRQKTVSPIANNPPGVTAPIQSPMGANVSKPSIDEPPLDEVLQNMRQQESNTASNKAHVNSSLLQNASRPDNQTNLLKASINNRTAAATSTAEGAATPKPKPIVKSSGGLFTPTGNATKSSKDNTTTTNKSSLDMTPVKQIKDFSPQVTPNYKQVLNNGIVPNMTYGTSFLFKSRRVQSGTDAPRENPSWSKGLRDLRVSSASASTSTAGAGNALVAVSPSLSHMDSHSPGGSRTPFGKLPRMSIYQEIQRDRERLERKREQEARERSQEWNEQVFPSSLSEKDKRKFYAEIIERHNRVKKGVEELKLRKESSQKPKDDPFKPLSPQQSKEVEQYWRLPGSKILVTNYKIDITVNDIKTLKDREWLNDNIIDYYLSMVTERHQGKSFCFSTHFYTTLQGQKGYQGVARWAKKKKIDVTKLDYVFVPINRSNTHWCLAVINNKEKKFQFFDSMGGYGTPALELLREYMILETDRLSPGKIEDHKKAYETYKICDKLDCPQQSNGSDCGVFTCKMAEVFSRGRDFAFTQKDMPAIRRKMVHEILTKTIL